MLGSLGDRQALARGGPRGLRRAEVRLGQALGEQQDGAFGALVRLLRGVEPAPRQIERLHEAARPRLELAEREQQAGAERVPAMALGAREAGQQALAARAELTGVHQQQAGDRAGRVVDRRDARGVLEPQGLFDRRAGRRGMAPHDPDAGQVRQRARERSGIALRLGQLDRGLRVALGEVQVRQQQVGEREPPVDHHPQRRILGCFGERLLGQIARLRMLPS